MTVGDDDIIDDVLRRLAEVAPRTEVERARIEFRQVWGGTTVYVRKKPRQPRDDDSGKPPGSG